MLQMESSPMNDRDKDKKKKKDKKKGDAEKMNQEAFPRVATNQK